MKTILSGYGVITSGAYNELIELAELLDAPVITTIKGKGSFPASHQLFAGEGLGIIGTDIGNKLLAKADSILFLGTRLTQLSTGGWSMKFKGFTMHNNIDGEDIGKVIMPHLPIVADTGLFLKEQILSCDLVRSLLLLIPSAAHLIGIVVLSGNTNLHSLCLVFLHPVWKINHITQHT